MSFDEYIFGKFVNYFKHKAPRKEAQNRMVQLDSVKPRLLLLARAVTGNAIELFPAVKEGGFKGNNFFLPSCFDFYNSKEQNYTYYLFRTLYLCSQQSLRLNGYNAGNLSESEAQRLAQKNAPLILEHLFDGFPVLQEIYEQLKTSKGGAKNTEIDAVWLYGKFMADTLVPASEDITSSLAEKIKNDKSPLPKTTLKARAVEEIVNLTVDIKQQQDYVLTHNFEKVDTADEFSGSWRDFDGEDELEDHKDALDELTMKFTVRTNDVVHSVYDTEFTDNAQIAESRETENKGHFILYDEWDGVRRKYKKDYSKVYPVPCFTSDVNYYQQTITQNLTILTQLRKMLASLSNRWVKQHLQTQGSEIDIDMLTDLFADSIAGHTPSEKVYISDRKREKDLCILLLLDISLSSDSYAAGNRIIDVAKQTAILFGEILQEYRIDFSVQCFYSQTRNYLSYITVKDFDEKWSAAKHKIGSLQPAGYTRIGPALRHSGSLLHNREANNKWIVLLSDGKPNDYDRYEGKYGINDVKQALRELHQNRINTYALAIEATARYYLPQMFGQEHYEILSSPAELLKALVKLYEKLRHGG